MKKCEYYLNRHPKDNEDERTPCEAFNRGYCEMKDLKPQLFNGLCPYTHADGFWNYDKANQQE